MASFSGAERTPIIPAMMLFRRSTLVALFSDIGERAQRLQSEQTQLFARMARIEGDAALNRLAVEVNSAVHAPSTVAFALEVFASAIRRPQKRGRAGGIARARQAGELYERWPDGRFMVHADCKEIEREIAETEYARHAAGGFARAATALRAFDGTFLAKKSE